MMKPGLQTLEELKAKGYKDVVDFSKVSPSDFQIDETFRFEGVSDPDDSEIIYAISSIKHSLKSVLINGYGIYADPKKAKIISQMKPKSDS